MKGLLFASPLPGITLSDYFAIILRVFFLVSALCCFVIFTIQTCILLFFSIRHIEMFNIESLHNCNLLYSFSKWNDEGKSIKSRRAQAHIVLKNKRVIFLCVPCGFCYVASGKCFISGCSFVGAFNGGS